MQVSYKFWKEILLFASSPAAVLVIAQVANKTL